MFDEALPISAKRNVVMPLSLIVGLVVLTATVTMKISGGYNALKQTDVDLANSLAAISRSNAQIIGQLNDYESRVEAYESRVHRLEMKDEYDGK